ncbi:hypothetical protein JW935_23635, partial [candidate division KSB1 bacterium]|nr:hypothetical protein [candidate division KSB1 bacterium]
IPVRQHVPMTMNAPDARTAGLNAATVYAFDSPIPVRHHVPPTQIVPDVLTEEPLAAKTVNASAQNSDFQANGFMRQLLIKN